MLSVTRHKGQLWFDSVNLLKHSLWISWPHLSYMATLPKGALQHGHVFAEVFWFTPFEVGNWEALFLFAVLCLWSLITLVEMQVWHTVQWKKFSWPPVLQTPQSSQWNYLLLVSLSKRLHVAQKYLPKVRLHSWQRWLGGCSTKQRLHLTSDTAF